MSIGIALIGTDGIILATDSRKTFLDNRHSDNSQKIFDLSPTVGIISIGGHAGYQDWLIDNYIYTQKLQPNDKKTKTMEDIINTFAHSAREDYDYITKRTSQFERLHPINRLMFIIAGYNSDGNPSIVNLDSGISAYPFSPDSMTSPPMCIVGVDLIWDYWVKKLEQANCKIETLNTKSLKLLVTFIIQETARASDLVGGKPQIIIIKRGKGIQRINNKEIERLQSQVDNLVDIGKLIAVL